MQRRAHKLSKPIKKKHLIVCMIIVSLWIITCFMGTSVHLPYLFVFNLSPNPWQSIDSETFPENRVRTIDFTDSYHGWVGCEDGYIMTTKDGGKTWEEQQSGINTTIKAIDFFNTNIGVAISEKDHILITQNGGVSWILLEKAKYPTSSGWKGTILWDVVTCDESTAWVLGNRVFFKVEISNQNWTFVSKIDLYLHHLAMLNSSHGWATGGYGAIVKTTDGWQSHEIQDAGVSKNFHGIFFWDVNIGWVVGDECTILGTTDGGDHWQVQYKNRPLIQFGVGFSLLDVFFVSKFKGWAVGSYGIHFTENGGKSWMCLPNTSGRYCITFANATHGWAIDHNKELSRMTKVGGGLRVSETYLNTIFSRISFGVISVSVLIVNSLLHLYRKRKF